MKAKRKDEFKPKYVNAGTKWLIPKACFILARLPPHSRRKLQKWYKDGDSIVVSPHSVDQVLLLNETKLNAFTEKKGNGRFTVISVPKLVRMKEEQASKQDPEQMNKAASIVRQEPA